MNSNIVDEPKQIPIIPPSEHKKPLRVNANVIGISLLALNLTPFLLSVILTLTEVFWAPLLVLNFDIGEQILLAFLYSIPFVVSILIVMRYLQMPFSTAFPLRKPKLDILVCSIGIALAGLVLGSMLTNSVADILAFTTQQVPTSPDMSAPRGTAANMLYFVNIAILPAILEEALFRGVLLQSLRRFGDSFALITSSILFGILHGNLVQLPYTLFMGLIIGYFVLYSGSLWPGIAIHFANNGLSVVLEWITRSTTSTEDAFIGLAFFFGRIIFGICCLIFLRSRLGSLFYIPPSSYPLKEKQKHSAFYATPGILFFLGVSTYYVVQYLEPYVAGAV